MLPEGDVRVFRTVFEHFSLHFRRALLLHHSVVATLASPTGQLQCRLANYHGIAEMPSSLYLSDFVRLEAAYHSLLVAINDLARFAGKCKLDVSDIKKYSAIVSEVWQQFAYEMIRRIPKDTFKDTEQLIKLLDSDFLSKILPQPIESRLTKGSIRETIYIITRNLNWAPDAESYLDRFALELVSTLSQNLVFERGVDENANSEDPVVYHFDFEAQFPYWKPGCTLSLQRAESERMDDDVFIDDDLVLLGVDEVKVEEQPKSLIVIPEIVVEEDKKKTKHSSESESRKRSNSSSRDSGLPISSLAHHSRHRSGRSTSPGRRHRRSSLSPSGRSGRHSQRSSSSERSSRHSQRSSSSERHRSRLNEARYHPYARKAKPTYERTNAPAEQLNKNFTRFTIVPTLRRYIPQKIEMEIPPLNWQIEWIRLNGPPRFRRTRIPSVCERVVGSAEQCWRYHDQLPRLIMHDQTFKLSSDYAMEYEWSDKEKASWSSTRASYWR